jgi:hypothetical protein
MSIYVEILIRAPLDEIWTHTQTPELHERWDLRFSHIDYLPRASEREPQPSVIIVRASDLGSKSRATAKASVSAISRTAAAVRP